MARRLKSTSPAFARKVRRQMNGKGENRHFRGRHTIGNTDVSVGSVLAGFRRPIRRPSASTPRTERGSRAKSAAIGKRARKVHRAKVR